MPSLVRLAITIRQARALVQLAEEADLDTFSSCGNSERQAELQCAAGVEAIERLHDAIGRYERTRAAPTGKRTRKI